jgi:nitrate/TMAO reductase-like tetraheme cytochrome c subunit
MGERTERERILGPFLDAYWRLPVPYQGEPPSAWSPLEQSLAPADCGACHPQQLADWRTSLHARAYSPGFAGQLLEGPLAAANEVRQCQTCHAPLEEQQPFEASGAPGPVYDPQLRQQGIVCASCHVRGHHRHGPPPRSARAEPAAAMAHGGFQARSEFQESRFCATCHQFFDDPGVEGKPIQNTFAEWRESPAAAEGRTCQSCHMPDRAHLWRGIHDPEMVRAAVEVELVITTAGEGRIEAELVLTSRDVGHALPTYVTPRIFLEVWQEDAAGQRLEATAAESVVGRAIDFGSWQEIFDTRIPPGGSHRLRYAEPRHASAAALVGHVRVDPGFHYRGVFDGLLPALSEPEARELIEEARRLTDEAAYALVELRRPLPADGPDEATSRRIPPAADTASGDSGRDGR